VPFKNKEISSRENGDRVMPDSQESDRGHLEEPSFISACPKCTVKLNEKAR
jgi:hypothetical protein